MQDLRRDYSRYIKLKLNCQEAGVTHLKVISRGSCYYQAVAPATAILNFEKGR